jgi:virulence-associated protein VagC
MAEQITVVDSPDTLHLSHEAQAALRLQPGSRLSIIIEDDCVILQPVEEDDLEALAGSLASSPSMADELQSERRSDKW